MVVPHQQYFGVQLLSQDLLHELFGGQHTEFFCKGQHHHFPIEGFGKQVLLFFLCRQQRRNEIIHHHRPRMAVESHADGQQVIHRSQFFQLLQKIAVAAVHTVEEAYGNSTTFIHSDVQKYSKLFAIPNFSCIHLHNSQEMSNFAADNAKGVSLDL